MQLQPHHAPLILWSSVFELVEVAVITWKLPLENFLAINILIQFNWFLLKGPVCKN